MSLLFSVKLLTDNVPKLFNCLYIQVKRQIKSGVIVSKRPKRYTEMKEWKQTVTCPSGVMAYRNIFNIHNCVLSGAVFSALKYFVYKTEGV